MASSEQPLPTAFASTESRQKRMETHAAFMKKSAGTQTALDHQKLNALHEKIVALVTNGMSDLEKGDLTYLLDIQWCNIVEEEEERIWMNKVEQLDSYVSIYLTLDWVYIVAYTNKLGNRNISFGSAKDHKPGFQARIRHSSGKLCWGYDYDNMTKDEQGKPLSVEYICVCVRCAVSGDAQRSAMTVELFQRVKEYVDTSMDECISQVFLVTHNYCSFKERRFLRECCIKADFKRIVIIKESFPTAYRILSKVKPDRYMEAPSVLVLENTFPFLKLEILGTDTTGNEVNAIHLHTAARGIWTNLDSVRNAYRRSLARLSMPKRDSIRYYVITDENTHAFFAELNKYLQDDLKLIKAENLSTNNNILEVFSYFSTNPAKLLKPTFGFNSPQQLKPVTEKLVKAIPARSDVPSENKNAAPPAKAKIPLKIEDRGGKMIDVIAYSDWTVKKLKDEYNRVNGLQVTGPLVLQYTKTQVLNDDNYLSKYKLEPDSIIRVHSDADDVALGNRAACNQVANYMARERGTEKTPGIKMECQVTPEKLFSSYSASPRGITEATNIKREVTGKRQLTAAEMLLKTCQTMEQQMSDGTVSMGALNRRIVTDSIKQAKLAVSEGMMGGPEAADIYELFKSMDFKEIPTQEAFPVGDTANVTETSMVDVKKLAPGKTQQETILIGNCLARKYGIVQTEVAGIKLKSWVAKIDDGIVTMGEVVSTGTINGLGKTVYVGVKFKKQLVLGSSGIKIQHVPGGEGHCDQCKGRKYIFIPRDQIGVTKYSLFQIQ